MVVMREIEDTTRAFSSFRVLNGDANIAERDQLFRNLALLFSYVSDRCEDEQVAQYDEVLCQLAGLVEIDARAHVAKLLAPLERAPGKVLSKLANDTYEVARPILEASAVLSDDELIDIATNRTEAHRTAIAGREALAARVSEAIVDHGGLPSVTRLLANPGAQLTGPGIDKHERRAAADAAIAEAVRPELRARQQGGGATPEPGGSGDFSAAAAAAGFSARAWRLAFGQVKAMADRNQLDERALARFARFGYSYHVAATLSVLLELAPEILLKWLADQDYVAVSIATRARAIPPELFEAVAASLPWRDPLSAAEQANVRAKYEALGTDEASGIFSLWRANAFRRRQSGHERNMA